MSDFETYMAIVKANIGIGILGSPKAFQNGGIVLSALSLATSAFFTTICVGKLI